MELTSGSAGEDFSGDWAPSGPLAAARQTKRMVVAVRLGTGRSFVLGASGNPWDEWAYFSTGPSAMLAEGGRIWNDDFLGARASRPHKAWHSFAYLPHFDQPGRMFVVCARVRRRGRKRWQGQDAGGTPALPGGGVAEAEPKGEG